MSDDPIGLTQRLDELAQLREQISQIYATERKRVRAAQLIEYRCSAKGAGCTLLAVWLSAELGGAVYYQPSYTLSDERNQQSSNAGGRTHNTTDGDRRWKERASSFDQLRSFGDAGGLHLNCDHRSVFVSATDLATAADSATPGKPTRRFV